MKAIKMNLLTALFCFFIIQSCSSDDASNNGNGGSNPPSSDEQAIQMEFNSNYQFVYSSNKVKDRNFYWATLVENDPKAKSAISSYSEFQQLHASFIQRIISVLEMSNPSALQIAEALKFKDSDKIAVSNAIKTHIENNPDTFTDINKDHIEPSGAFNHFSEVTDSFRVHQLIVEQMINGINNIIDTYAAGIDPKYPNIDRISYDVNSSQYKQWMKDLLNEVISDNENNLFYEPFLEFALGVLELNNRDEAGRFVPLESGHNQLTYNYIQNINWDDYQYSMIVVLGDSPNSPGDLPNISQGGIERSDRGVELFNQGLAPIIAFTGSNLAPFQTSYHEAIEMKNYVMQQHNIPEIKILVEPHARHTTTNLRNISRLIYKYKIPTDKKAIVTTSVSHSDYVTSNQYLNRSMNEMNHIPVEFHNRISNREVEFTPLIKVLHLNSVDPLDP